MLMKHRGIENANCFTYLAISIYSFTAQVLIVEACLKLLHNLVPEPSAVFLGLEDICLCSLSNEPSGCRQTEVFALKLNYTHRWSPFRH